MTGGAGAFAASPISLKPRFKTSFVANVCSLPSTSNRMLSGEPLNESPLHDLAGLQFKGVAER